MNGVIAIIPARGGSKGIKDKNLQHVGGIPLLARTIIALQGSSVISSVYVSTDSNDIAKLARLYGAQVVMRPSNLSDDAASSESAILHAIETIRDSGTNPTSVVFAQCTSPFIEPSDVDGIIDLLNTFDSALTVTDNHSFIWRQSSDGSATGINHEPAVRLPRQMLPQEFRETGALYAFNVAGFEKSKHRFFGRVGMYPVPTERSMEIDEPYDLVLANQLAASLSKVASTPNLKNFKSVVFDFDGVLTDNLVSVDSNGLETVNCSRSDGMGIQMLKDAGYSLLILSKERNAVVTARGKKLDIEVIQGCDDKLQRLVQWLADKKLLAEECIYIGNDINDRECMEFVGMAFAPADAHPSVDTATTWKLNANGGAGAARELADLLLRSKASPLS